MAGQEKEMGLANLENFLKREFPENNKVNILLEQITKSKAELEKETGEENPFFYGAITRYMKATASKGIDSWVDSKGNVNIAQINVVAKIAKKEFEAAKEKGNTEEQSKKVFEQQEEFIKQEFTKIDYNNLTGDNLSFIAQNMEMFRDTASYEDYSKAVETMEAVLVMNPTISDLQKLAKFQEDNLDKPLDKKQREIFNSAPEELKSEDGKSFDQQKMKQLDILLGNVYCFVNDEIDKGNLPNQKDILDHVKERMERMNCEIPEKLLGQMFEIGLIKELEGKSREEQQNIINQKIKEQNEKHRAESNLDKKEEISQDKEEEFSPELANNDQEQSQLVEEDTQKSETQIQEENEQMMNAEFEQIQDYSETSQEASLEDDMFGDMGDGSDFFAALAEEEQKDTLVEQNLEEKAGLEQEENLQESTEQDQTSTLEGMDNIEQEEYEAPTFEEEKSGIAKFFDTIKNLRPVQAIRKAFAPREEQKKLNAPTNQRTEDGVRYTEYEQNGSLLPVNIRARNFLRNISVKAVEAVTNGIKNLTERNKQEDAVLNKPEIIKSADSEKQQETKEQQLESINLNQQQTHVMEQYTEGQVLNVAAKTDSIIVNQGTTRDNNPWAVPVNEKMEEMAIANALNSATKVHNESEVSQDKKIPKPDDGTR